MFLQVLKPIKSPILLDQCSLRDLASLINLISIRIFMLRLVRGFSVPTVAESQTPEGQINTNLKPEMAWNDSIRTFDLIAEK